MHGVRGHGLVSVLFVAVLIEIASWVLTEGCKAST